MYKEKFKEFVRKFLIYQIANKKMFYKVIDEHFPFTDPEYTEVNDLEDSVLFHFEGYNVKCTIVYEHRDYGYKIIDVK